jgi:FkbM family methyltransferase
MSYRKSLSRLVPAAIRHRIRSSLSSINAEDIALRFLDRRLPDIELKLAFYDPLTGTLRFPESFFAARWLLRSGMIIDAVPWMLKLEAYIPEGGIIFDVGGHQGITTQWFSRKARHVHTFEPMPENVDTIRTALAVRGIKNVTVHPVAVSDHVGIGDFHIYQTRGHNSLARTNASGYRYSIPTETTMLDDFADENGIESIDFLKIDVEGFELEVLKGATKLLSARRIGCLLFEADIFLLSSIGKSAGSIYDLLVAHGYEVTNLDQQAVTRKEVAESQYGDFLARPRPSRSSAFGDM